MCVNDVVTIANLIDVGIQGAILEQLNLIESLSLAKDNKTRLLEFDTILLNRWEGSKVIKELGNSLPYYSGERHEVNAILRGDGGIAIHDLFSIHGEDASSSVKAKTLSSFALSLYLQVIYARVGLPQYLNATQLCWGVYLNLCPYYDHWLARDTPVGLQILIESVVLAQLSGNVSEVENLNRELHMHNVIFQDVSSNVWRGEHIVEVRVKLGLEFFLGEMRWGFVDPNDLDDVLSCRGNHGMRSEAWSRADGRDEVNRKWLSHTHKKAPWTWYQNTESSHEE
ncbi:hypothetical protein K438DRAFT_1784456 [Mycena galopus ATCC 62051]|nr:hypothetical protein K438DRAFT_1784456 [Mycena galopus ATCC 62051]